MRLAAIPMVLVVAAALAASPTTSVGGASDDPDPHAHDPDPHAHDHDGHAHLGELGSGRVAEPLTLATDLDWRTPAVDCDGDCPTFTYEVDVAEEVAGHTVQFAIDDRWIFDEADLTVITPDGTSASDHTDFQVLSGTAEFTEAPAGRYVVTVAFRNARDGFVRVRAMTVPPRELTGTLLPNLRALPPYDFTFTAPFAQDGPSLVGPTYPEVGMSLGGQRLQSCTVDEQATALDPTQPGAKGALVTCLRFSTGPENIGDGHLDLRFETPVNYDEPGTFPMVQFVHDADGSTRTRAAGSYEFHPSHGHYHHAEMAVYDLFAVDGDDLTLVAGGVKTGFCPLDLGLADWGSPYHAPAGTVQGLHFGNCLGLGGLSLEPGPQSNGQMGLSAGWVDVYDRVFPGQFVDFTGQPDGEYVVRVTMDRDDLVLESDETDNVSYALIAIAGEQITVLERGYGFDHTDPDRVVATDGRTTHPMKDLTAVADPRL